MKFDGAKLKETWESKTPEQAYVVLSSNDIDVTNKSDKAEQLPKLLKLNEFAIAQFAAWHDSAEARMQRREAEMQRREVEMQRREAEMQRREAPTPKPTEKTAQGPAPKPADNKPAVSAKLVGGYYKGDRVATKIDVEAQSIKTGDIGTIIGPCPNEKLADQEMRVRVEFGPGKGLVDLHTGSQIKPAEALAGGYYNGDRVVSKIDYEAQSIKTGDIGTIVGPCLNEKLADQEMRVRVQFGPGKGLLDLVPETQFGPA